MKKLFSLLLTWLLVVTIAGCADNPDFKLTGAQEAGIYTFYPVSDKDAEPDPILNTTLNYIYGKCTDVIVENVADSEMKAVYLCIKNEGKDEYIVAVSASDDMPDFDESRIKGKTVVVYGQLLTGNPNSNESYKRLPGISAFYFSIDDEIYSTPEFIDYLEK